jgi:hypothetical protein
MKNPILQRVGAAFGALMLSTTMLYAAVGELSWSGKTTWTYNKEIMGDKPGDQWDSQKTDQEANPVKWVLHKSGGNPVIWLRIDDTVSNSDSTQMMADLKNRFESRGISVNTSVQEKTIGGQKVYIISGLDNAKGFRYSAAVFPRAGTKRAYYVELTAPEKEFSTFEPAYMGMVQTIRLLPVATSPGY